MGLCQTLNQKMIKNKSVNRNLTQLRRTKNLKKILIKFNLKKRMKKKETLLKMLKENSIKIKTIK
jgi:hypothetical protein